MTDRHGVDHRNSLKYTLFFTFFVFAMLTNVIGAVTNILLNEFGLTLGGAGLISLSFFTAYGLASLPGGILAHRYGYKAVLVLGSVLMSAGSLLFGLVSTYNALVAASFITGIGVTLIQVSANPLVRYAGAEKDYPRNLTVVHSIFGFGSFIAPLMLMQLVAGGISWRYFYFLVVAVSLLLVLSLAKAKAPGHIPDTFSIKSIISHVKNGSVASSFVALFFYVGLEMGVAVWLITFLDKVKGIDPGTGVFFLSLYWLLLAVGRYIGSHLLKTHTPKRLVISFALFGAVSLAIGLYGSASLSMLFLPLVGFSCSIIFPTIYSVTLENEKKDHGLISGILFTSVIGGAIIPYLIGLAGDAYGLVAGLSMLFICFLVILLRGASIKRRHIEIEEPASETI